MINKMKEQNGSFLAEQNGSFLAEQNGSFLAEQLGVPVFIIRMRDCILEGLPLNRRSPWTRRFFEAIKDGADLSTVMPKFLKLVLEKARDAKPGTHDGAVNAINQTVAVIDEWVETGKPNAVSAANAANAATNAANDPHAHAVYAHAHAAHAAHAAHVAHAAHAAVNAAVNAVYAHAHADYASYTSCCQRVFIFYADSLIDLIRECNDHDHC